MTKSAKDITAANGGVETLSAEAAAGLRHDPRVVLVDVREKDEIEKTGMIDGAVHVPRGLLEFQVDPESPSHKPELGDSRKLVLYCASGNRSALAVRTLLDMGRKDVAHVAGGFPALKEAWAKAE